MDLNEGSDYDLWFQSDEFDSIKRHACNLIQVIKQGRTGGIHYCTRGLEKYFNAEIVQQRRNEAWDSVLREQELQRLTSIYDDLMLSHAYQNYSNECMLEALHRGKMDEESIKLYTRHARQILGTQNMPVTDL